MTGNNLTGILNTLSGEAKNGKLKVHDVVKALNHKGFGPLLLAPAIVVVLPTGAIPGIPLVCAVLILLLSVQIVFGKRYPWIPSYLDEMTIEAKRFEAGVNRIKPYTQLIDRYVRNRFSILAKNEISKRIVALTSMALAFGIMFIGFIPMAPAIFALPILFFALGLSVHDGILMAVGYSILLLIVLATPFVLQ